MTLARARVLRSGEYRAAALNADQPNRGGSLGRVVPRVSVEAAEQAQAILAKAQEQARALIERAEREAAQVRLQATAEGHAAAVAELAARAIALRSHELAAATRTLDQQVQLAQLLAERVLGEELRLAPERVIALAKQALGEARGARQICIEAHPQDASLLEQSLSSLRLQAGTVEVKVDPLRQRGHLRIVTEVGVLDAALGPQLGRLTEKLRESLEA